MDSDSNNRDDNAGKRCNHEATNGYHAVAVAIGNSNSSFNDGADDDDDAKMPASDAAYYASRDVSYDANNNAPFGSAFDGATDSKTPVKFCITDNHAKAEAHSNLPQSS